MKNESRQDFLPFRPRKLISLMDMIPFVYYEFEMAHGGILRWQNIFEEKASKSEQKGCITNEERTAILTVIGEAKTQCAILELSNAHHIIWQIELDFFHPNASPLYQTIATQFRSLWNAMTSDFSKIKLAFIPAEKTKYFEQEYGFGMDVFNAFSSARRDIKDAGNCRAADLHAATMYHLMCVVNLGLIALARHLRVIIKKTPLEYAEWQSMIDKIEKKMKQKTVKPPGNDKMAKSEVRAFYNGLLAEFKLFKDMRNDVMHARNDYNEAEVENAHIRVRDFMQRLARQHL